MDYDQRRLIRTIFHGMLGDARNDGSTVAAHMPTFYMLANAWSFGHVVELGVNRGWSTTALFAGAANAGKKLISYDVLVDCHVSLRNNLGVEMENPVLRHWDFRVKDSILAAGDFEDGSVSLWFLDTIHTLDHTRKELAAWLPKIHPQGIMCGHDYLLPEFGGLKYGVKEAVDEFAEAHRDRFKLHVLPHDCGLFVLFPKSFG
jgi:predicted O-methyltransferase YrrM